MMGLYDGFITTHSAHFLDTEGAAVFHVRLVDGCTQVSPATLPGERSTICADLGYKASDLMQANSVIWVEGPSDRVYLNHWIKAVAPHLEEGLHYSIMFYSGALMGHLTATDSLLDEFISLRRLNRHSMIVMDSDRSKAGERMKEYKRRLRDEFDNSDDPGFAWVTKGREIENYVPPDLMIKALKKVHPSAVSLDSAGVYAFRYHFRNRQKKKTKDVKKVSIAREVAQFDPVLDILDLRVVVNRVVRFIEEANK